MQGQRRGWSLPAILVDAAVIGVAAVIAVALYRDGRSERLLLSSEDWADVAGGDQISGAAEPDLTLVEFVDYQCPACLVVEGVLAELSREHPGRIRRVVRHFPLTRIHPQAHGAALAAVCAGEQGVFERMHGMLFEFRDLVARERWDSVAVVSGVPQKEEFTTCLTSADAAAQLAADVNLGKRLGVAGTPTLILDGEWLRHVDPPTLRVELQQRLK